VTKYSKLIYYLTIKPSELIGIKTVLFVEASCFLDKYAKEHDYRITPSFESYRVTQTVGSFCWRCFLVQNVWIFDCVIALATSSTKNWIRQDMWMAKIYDILVWIWRDGHCRSYRTPTGPACSAYTQEIESIIKITTTQFQQWYIPKSTLCTLFMSLCTNVHTTNQSPYLTNKIFSYYFLLFNLSNQTICITRRNKNPPFFLQTFQTFFSYVHDLLFSYSLVRSSVKDLFIAPCKHHYCIVANCVGNQHHQAG